MKLNKIHLQGGNYENGDAHSYTQTNNIMKKFALTKENPDLKYPLKPEKSYKNCGWTDWRKYGL